MWNELFIEEQCRLAQLLIERVIIAYGCLEIFWNDQGWPILVKELLRLTLLEPAIVQPIFAGQQSRWFQGNSLPADWVAQREIVSNFDA